MPSIKGFISGLREDASTHSHGSDEPLTGKQPQTIESTVEESSLKSESTVDAKNPFLDPIVAKYYRDTYEKSKYECRERFDPEFTWTEKEEKKIVWRLEWRVTFLACFMFVALQTDRGNLSQAVADNMLEDLGMTTNQYNTGNTIFYLCFLCAELPSQLVSKKLGPDVWIPTQMMLWSVVAMSQAALKGNQGFYATRALLGLLEGGFIPDLVLWMSYFYTGSELSVRLSFFWTTLSLTTIITSLLAAGLLKMRGVAGWAGWQWLFLIEGIYTFLIGLASAFLMVPSVVQTKKPWNKKGWFTYHEEKILVNRVLRDDPTKGDMHNRQAITPYMLFQAICDYDLWPVYFIGLIAYIPTGTLTAYLTLCLKSLNFTTFQVNLLAIPYNVIHIVLLLGITWFSERFNERSFVCLFQPFWTIPLLAILRFWPGSMVNKWGTWVVATLMLGNPYIHAICVSWCSRNSRSIKNRTVSASLYNMFVQAGSIIASNIYRTKDKPLYHQGNSVLLGIACALIPVLLLTKVYYVWRNKSKAKKWDAMSIEQREEYLATTTDQGTKRLDFRFVH
ncbi:unnamed protein product [Kuraishia capsulata CBS 1993]|uniref:Major facilitator superfamily (MFS) profile domain-containing protein n=1 Tax=Kuraishia capsulata CBS 1993 TaxID=1382522 RepID=W6MNB5_9ASCO|nr:uncharacterized protein KUCA_T00002474001 [Kuraishia capsulata CBS 1993]CDK26502.1 unnamed protein product [Kuraishia capsulata CBS 1993]